MTSAWALAALLAATPVGTSAHSPAVLCRAGETALFACRLNAGSVALCNAPGGVVARMQSSDGSRRASRRLTFASEGYSGGGESQVNLASGKTMVTIYERLVRSDFAANAPNAPVLSTGVLTTRAGKTVSDQRCQPTSIIGSVSAASARLPRSEFIEQ